MKKRILCAVCVMTVLIISLSVVMFSSAANEQLYASRIGFDNGNTDAVSADISYQIGDSDCDGFLTLQDSKLMNKYLLGVDVPTNDQFVRTNIDADTDITLKDKKVLSKMLLGLDTGLDITYAGGASISYDLTNMMGKIVLSSQTGTVTVDLRELELGDRKIDSAVINADTDCISVTPLYDGLEHASATDAVLSNDINGAKYFVFPENGRELTGLMITYSKSDSQNVLIKELFVCEGKYSAEWICNNRILPSEGTSGTLTVSKESERLALRFGQMTEEDKTNTGEGLYHDFVNSKWPSIAVDENDKLYVTASGCRMRHVDPFGSTVMVTSTDGGVTFTKPKQISNTIMDDRDAGICYMGDGKMLVSYFTNNADSYLPGGSNYSVLMRGSSASWQADSWDSSGNPIGGINGTYVDMLKYFINNVPDYNTDYASYVVKSTDYGNTWDSVRYSAPSGTSTAVSNMINNYQITYPGTRVPVTSCHGPVKLSDGTVLFAGKVLDTTDQARDTMAVYTSDDEGATWNYLSEIERPQGYGPNNFHELSVTETNDGALLCAIRTQPSEDGTLNVSPMYTVFTCFSYDKGKTWTVPEATNADGTPPHVFTASNGDIIMTVGYRSDPRAIYAYVSRDGGRTWSNSVNVSGTFLNGDDMGYPASAMLSDGTVVTVYYGTYHKYGNEQYSSILSTRWEYSFK